MVYLALAVGGTGNAVDIGEGTIHIPFQVGDGSGAQHGFDLLKYAIPHLLAGEIVNAGAIL